MGATASTAAKYTIRGAGNGTLTANPDSVSTADNLTYTLTWNAGLMLNGQTITITVANGAGGVLDGAGNILDATVSGSDDAIEVMPSFTVTTTGFLTVDVVFNRAVHRSGGGALQAGDFTIGGAGVGTLSGVAPLSATTADNITFALTWDAGYIMHAGSTITIAVAGALDAADNAVSGGAVTSGNVATAAVPTITSAVALTFSGVHYVIITFAQDVDPTSAAIAGNYSVSSGSITGVDVPAGVVGNVRTAVLTVTNNMAGGTVTVGTNVKDAALNSMAGPWTSPAM
jgi:hypothetical protein